jgi:Leucine-rich repeat (LRR) protein
MRSFHAYKVGEQRPSSRLRNDTNSSRGGFDNDDERGYSSYGSRVGSSNNQLAHKQSIASRLFASRPNHGDNIIIDETVIDGYRMLAGCRVSSPEEAVHCRMLSCNPPLLDIVPEHLAEFKHLTHLDLGGNRLPMEKLHMMESLSELLMPCNMIRDIRLLTQKQHKMMKNKRGNVDNAHTSGGGDVNGDDGSGGGVVGNMSSGGDGGGGGSSSGLSGASLVPQNVGFISLATLDLSFNQLTVDSVAQLCALPALTDLNLASNGLTSLPSSMSAFLRLKKLNLQNNLLGDGAPS